MMCDLTLDGKRQEKDLLKSLKIDQLFSVEILIEEIVVTHGPYKNSGDLDNITETESEESDGVGEEEGAEDSLTVGMALLDERPPDEGTVRSARSRGMEPPVPRGPPKIKRTCHTIPIDSWPPGLISSKAYVPPTDDYPQELLDRPFQLCADCSDRCKDTKPERMKKCECPKEICYRFPIDSWGPGIRSSSGIERTKCVCTATVGRPQSRKGRPKSGDSKGDKKNRGDGKDKGGKDLKKGGKKKIVGEQVIGAEEEDETLLDAEPKKPKKKKNKRCKRPPKPEGPLPPLMVTISAFQIKDIKIHQVDLDKLYPPQGEDANLEEESEPKIEEEQEKEIKEPLAKEKVKKGDSKKTAAKTKDKGKGAGSKASIKSSGSSKQSRNIIKPTKGKRSAPKANVQAVDLASSMPADVETSDEEDHSPLSKYRGLGGADAPKCSGDLEARLKEVGKERRQDYRRRKEVIESLRACTEFMRGVSFLFASTPLDIITWLLVDKLEIQVDRCGPNGPVYPIGTVKVRLPAVLRDKVQVGARQGRRRALWSCLQDNFPIIDCKGQHVGDLSLYLCLSSLGRALVSTSLASDSNLYQFTDSACYIGSTKPHRATAFANRYNNLHRITMKYYDLPKPPLLSPNN